MSSRPLTLIRLVAALVLVSARGSNTPTRPQGCEFWVAPAPAGSNSNPGTLALPWATLDYASAQTLALGGSYCTVWFKDGTYDGLNRIGERFATPITFRAANPFKVIFQNSGPALQVAGGYNLIFDGFQFRHTGTGADQVVVHVFGAGNLWPEQIVFRNNIFHDSYNNDLLTLNTGGRFITVEGNIFYNQQGSDEHIDVNGVTDITIQDNIFFNDFAGSGRSNANDTAAFVVIKDSDGIIPGTERVAVRRNIFLNWEGSDVSKFVQIGEDGKPYYEAKDVRVENNLMIGNSGNVLHAAFGVRGGKDVIFANNTVVGNLPSRAYAFRLDHKGSNPPNQNIYFYNNIWSDPTGTMGAPGWGGNIRFSDGSSGETNNLILDNNLYWNGGAAIPPGQQINPLVHDVRRVVTDPLLNTDQSGVILPRWNASNSSFVSGNTTIRQEFVRLVEQYGNLPTNSPAIGRADPAVAPADDILGQMRPVPASLGAYEAGWGLSGTSDLTAVYLRWTDPRQPSAASLTITYTLGATSALVTGLPVATRAYTLTNLQPYSLYVVTLTARDGGNAILAQSNSFLVLTTDRHAYLPLVKKNSP